MTEPAVGDPAPKALDVPSVAGLVAAVLWVGARLTDRVDESLEWYLYLLLGTVLPAILVTLPAIARRWPRRVEWTHGVHLVLTAIGVAAAVDHLLGNGFDPRAAVLATIGTAGAAVTTPWPAPDPAQRARWAARLAVFFVILLAATHGFLAMLWWPSAPAPALDGVVRTAWLVALAVAMGAWAHATPRPLPMRVTAALVGAAGLVVIAASLRVPDFEWNRVWHHWGAIVSPAAMVRDGGTLLWDVPSQYGLLSTFTVASVPFVDVWEAMRLVNAAALATSAFALFAILFAIRRSAVGFVAALALTLVFVFLIPGDAEPLWGPFTLPSFGSFRFVWAYLMLAVAVWESRASEPGQRPRGAWLAGSVVFTIGCLWSFESAVYCVATWIPALVWSRFHLARKAHATAPEAVGAVLRALALPAASLGLVAVAIEAWYRSVKGIAPDFASYTEYALSFVTIYAALPIEPDGPLVGVIALFAVLCAALSRAFGSDRLDAQVAALAAFGAAWSTTSYFVSSSRAETADSVMPIWLAAIGVVWFTSERRGGPWSLPMARWIVSTWAACLLFAATYDPERLEPFARALLTDPTRRVTPALQPLPEELSALMRQAGVDPDDRFVLLFPNVQGTYDPNPDDTEHDDVRIPQDVWLPLAVLLRPLPERRREEYLDRQRARGIDRGWYAQLATAPFMGKAFLWKHDEMIDARYVVTRSYRNERWVLQWREPR